MIAIASAPASVHCVVCFAGSGAKSSSSYGHTRTACIVSTLLHACSMCESSSAYDMHIKCARRLRRRDVVDRISYRVFVCLSAECN